MHSAPFFQQCNIARCCVTTLAAGTTRRTRRTTRAPGPESARMLSTSRSASMLTSPPGGMHVPKLDGSPMLHTSWSDASFLGPWAPMRKGAMSASLQTLAPWRSSGGRLEPLNRSHSEYFPRHQHWKPIYKQGASVDHMGVVMPRMLRSSNEGEPHYIRPPPPPRRLPRLQAPADEDEEGGSSPWTPRMTHLRIEQREPDDGKPVAGVFTMPRAPTPSGLGRDEAVLWRSEQTGWSGAPVRPLSWRHDAQCRGKFR